MSDIGDFEERHTKSGNSALRGGIWLRRSAAGIPRNEGRRRVTFHVSVGAKLAVFRARRTDYSENSETHLVNLKTNLNCKRTDLKLPRDPE